jgi:hypothetical protein
MLKRISERNIEIGAVLSASKNAGLRIAFGDPRGFQ